MVENMKQLQELENMISAVLLDIKQSVANEVKANVLDGVKLIHPRSAFVSFSTVQKEHRLILDPGYYIQECQTDFVQQKLNSVKTLADFKRVVNEMCDTGYAKIGTTKNKLNPNTVSVLQKYLVEDN